MTTRIYVSDVPDLLKLWDWEGNGDLLPQDMTARNNKKAAWVCDRGHKYKATVYSQYKGSRCPYCTGKRAIVGENDLATLYPDIAQQWDKEKNSLTPQEVKHGSHKKAWWICDKGHSWQASIKERCLSGNGCPYCAGKRAIPGKNDLATLYPDIAKQWDEKKNGCEIPDTLLPQSRKKSWWRCDKNHLWEAPVRYRYNGHGCPYCTRQKSIKGENDLLTMHPHLAQQWDDDKNDLQPQDVTCGSGRIVWWKCDLGHSWEAMVKKRVSGHGCPYCSGRRALLGFNDLKTTHPDLVRQWDIKKNGNITPDMVTSGTCEKAWWVCDKGHSWESVIRGRANGGVGCPYCVHHISKAEQDIADYVSALIGEENVIQSDRSVLQGKELDIYIPSYNIAIEFNGIYWHTESQGKNSNYHYSKWQECKDKGIQLITIWEDEWKGKQDIVKSMLTHKLGVSQDRKVYARKTTVKEIESAVAQDFLEDHHIQGSVASTVYSGLVDEDGILVALSSWKKIKDILYLDRYATSCMVVGGMGKILEEGKRIAKEYGCTKIVTFSDNQVSDGGLYEKLGFSKDKDLLPDYKYLVDEERIHKFNYRINRFKKDPTLIYEEGSTERDLAEINGLERVWDCGKTRWVMEV